MGENNTPTALKGCGVKIVLIPGLHILVHPHSNEGSETHETKTWMFPLNEITIKIPRYTKLLEKKCVISSDFWFVPTFYVFLPLYALTSKMDIINCHYIFTMIPLSKTANAQKYGIKVINFFRFGVCFKILRFPSIIYVDK